MHVRYVYDQLLPSRDTDTEQVLSTVSALGRRGVDVTLAIPQLPQAPLVDAQALRAYYQVKGPFTVDHSPALTGVARPIQKTAHGLRATRAEYHADLVYTRNLHAVAFALWFGQRVVFEHFRPWADQHPAIEPALFWMFRHPNFLGAVLHSRHVRESYLRVGLSPDGVLIAYNGYEPERMEPRLTAAEARGMLNLPAEAPLVVYAGRVHEKKGLSTVLDLARRVPEATFVLVGSEGEGRIEREARSLANVIVRPWQRFDATIRYLYASDVLLIPPTLEPLTKHGNTVLPMKLFQYLASGRPILAPAAPDTAELLVQDRTAVLVPPGEPDRHATALRALLADPERGRRIAAFAVAQAATLTWDARAERIERFLSERLAAHASKSARQASASWNAGQWLARTARWAGKKVVRTR